MPAPRLTASQKEVFALYRKGLRSIRSKPEENRPNFLLYLRHFFKHPNMGGGLTRRDFSAIEYMKRRCDKMLDEVFLHPGVKDIRLPPQTEREMSRLGLDFYRRSQATLVGSEAEATSGQRGSSRS
ncbi:hypothetical protein IE53DRAFT_310518 [Violaceomyces palustris]|uniref:Uncharacterized protein n=1 Tax=Violaceomyces palustris TaxID=1673888 RepID=A0ACD0P5K1_9BASI|nr:hypothetical protein IE53DRAFT_310518 [Violaceomyces palustris]